VWEVLKTPLVLLLATCAFLEYAANYCGGYFLPTILQKLSGLSDAKVGLLGALPYAVTLITVVVVGWHSDRTAERRWHATVLLMLGAVGVAALAVHPGSVTLTVALLAVTCATTLAFVPLFWSLVPDLLGASRAAAAIGTINAIASIGGFVGPLAFGNLTTRTGSFTIPLLLVAALTAAAALLILRVPSPHKVDST
jgi:MFS family permease